ncbi:hypothetical protein MSG28_002766 [Choristoneura fumiferana]|uniref:Uncharacterized protein n=1 Tax=Choristoneura fumiferana TaxID=7141 RepID=A0ACC0JK13_CHOFU|nr:hypothetical protein MSG28_002766 [Choristoneura fumiferana]
MAPEIKYTKLFINNEWVDAKSGKTFATYTPHDGSVIAHVAEGDKADIDLAVSAAKAAFHRNSEWRLLDASARGRLLNKFADLVERDAQYLVELESYNNGMLLNLAVHFIQNSSRSIRYYASLADKIQGDTIPAGCTVVVKPAEQTPLTALALAALFKEAGFPPGVVNVVNGFGPGAGTSLTHHPDVAKISFTGSAEVGKLIQQAAGKVNLKRVTLELGGKSPLVIMNDADLNVAVPCAANGVFGHQGQICIAASRLFVQSGIYDEFVKRAVEFAKNIKIGNPTEPTTQHGPQVDGEMMEKVLGYIEKGKREGAKLLTGGKRVGTKGFYIEPTVFAGVTDEMTIAKEEIFGPVQSILKFDTLEEVLDRANNTNYGLAAGIFTKDINNALQFAKHAEAGNVCGIACVEPYLEADIDLAVSAAKAAFHRNSEWRLLDASARGRLLNKFADLIQRDTQYLAELESYDNGMLIGFAMRNVAMAENLARYNAGLADKIQGDTIPADGEVFSYTLKQPVGVCGLILPWNVPILMFAAKVTTALAAGCTVVVKPAEQSPLTALALAALLNEAGFPPGVVNVVPGFGPGAGSSLTHHPDVAKISFTGSVEVGKLIQRTAGEVNLKRVSLELGGKNPLVIMNDADLELAVRTAANGVFANQGQICLAASRLYVQSGIYDQFVQKAVDFAKNIKIGNPSDPTSRHGPQIDLEMMTKVLGYIEIGKQEGAKLMTGGDCVGDKGFYIQPAVFINVTDDMTIAKEEIFGPVQCILKFDTLEDVIDRANNTNYGLVAGIFTSNINTALQFSKHVQAGTIWVNNWLVYNVQADIDLAVSAAKAAFHRNSEWRLLDASQRCRLLNKFADLIQRDAKYLAELESYDNGMNINKASEYIDSRIKFMRYCASLADKIQGDTIPADGDVFTYTLKQPTGVCGLILPWNSPISNFVTKVTTALAAGCTVVVKPAEQTPLTALVLAELVKEAGIPAGVVNVVPGMGSAAGSSLTHHPDVAMISFTGSVEVGKLIQKAAGETNLKRVTLELGGKSPLIIMNDADVNTAVRYAANGVFANQGQVCIAASRLFVQSSIYDEFVKKAVEEAKKIKVGNPADPTNHQGPQVSEAMMKKVLGYIETGKKEGAKLLTGGKRIGTEGYYIEPAVFADVTDDMTIAKEEIFGPVQSILKLDTLEEVLGRANNTSYGLSAGIFTNNINIALQFAKHVEAGIVCVNTYPAGAYQAPFGGFKDSGIGRERGMECVNEFLEIKSVSIAQPKKF